LLSLRCTNRQRRRASGRIEARRQSKKEPHEAHDLSGRYPA
jgi:hypothetical protein